MRRLEIISRRKQARVASSAMRLEVEVKEMVLRLRRLAVSVEVLLATMVLLELPSMSCWLMSA
jgi:hypothetical protein